VLAPDAELRASGPAGTVVIRGAGEIAAQAGGAARPDARRHPAVIDGVPGVLITVDGRPVTVIAFTVAGDAITAIRVLADPARLAKVVPSWVA
jgi:hypothetical protein